MTGEIGRGRRWASAAATLGGAGAVYGSVLTWATVAGRRRGRTFEADGADLWGELTVAAGLVAIVAGLLTLTAGRSRTRLWLSGAVLLAGLAATAIAVFFLTGDQAVLDRLADAPGFRARRRAVVNAEPGLFVVLMGGVVSALGGIGGVLSARERASVETAAANVLEGPPAAGREGGA